jgi:hypothetical protein
VVISRFFDFGEKRKKEGGGGQNLSARRPHKGNPNSNDVKLGLLTASRFMIQELCIDLSDLTSKQVNV